MGKKIVIVGGGIAGMSAGIYAQKCGFDSVIYEKHSVAGGECTGWMREKHYIDNCICWMTGAKEGYDIYPMWKELGFIPEGVQVHQHDYFYKSELNGQSLYLWRDLKRAEADMIALSPEDKKEIKKFFKHVKYAECLQVPAKKPTDMMNLFDWTDLGLKMIKMVPVINKYGKVTLKELGARFKHPLIKKIFSDYLPEEYLAHIMMNAYGAISSGGGGIPLGGSFAAAQRMRKIYESLGGTILLNQDVSEICIENGHSSGIILSDGTKVDADYVICTTDPHFAFEKLMDYKYMPPLLKKAYEDPEHNPLISSFQAAYSYDGMTDEVKGRMFFDCKPFDLCGRPVTRMNLKNYTFEKTTLPDGKNLLQVKLLEPESEYLWWEKLYNTDKAAYDAEKARVAKDVEKAIIERFPFMEGKLTLLNTWTPVTYNRYCNAYRGVFMTFLQTHGSMNAMAVPGVLKGVNNVFIASQWLLIGGGLPGAMVMGKFAVQRILKKEKRSIKI